MRDFLALDVCCGSRMFYFNKHDPHVIYSDIRAGHFPMKDSSTNSGIRDHAIIPDLQADFTALPFPAAFFNLVIFDPPHLRRCGPNSWARVKFGALTADWKPILRQAFAECFRVLLPAGLLIFKWCEFQIPLSSILPLSLCPPLLGHKSGKRSQTHWLTFINPL